MNKEMIEEREESKERFFDQLKAAITLAGGNADHGWEKVSLEEVYDILYPNGIKLAFTFHGKKRLYS